MAKPILGSSGAGNIAIDVDVLIGTRLLIEGGSGSGKSWAIRRLLEQTHGAVQQIVIDPEEEFHTLREKFDYVLAGRTGGDCPAEVRSARLLARRLLELGVSAIVSLFELKAHERLQFVNLFVQELVDAPKNLWHPVLVVIDECHMFANQESRGESSQAVIDLATRGRKRGQCLVAATQRPSMLDKNVSAQCVNKMIGRFSLDIDVARAAKDIGFYKQEDQAVLRGLKQGEFFVTGPALSETVQRTKVGAVQTTHPKAGQLTLPPTPPTSKVKAILGKLADLPKEAEAEAQTIAALQARVRELERAVKTVPQVDPAAIQNAVSAESDRWREKTESYLRTYLTSAENLVGEGLSFIGELESLKQKVERELGESVNVPVGKPVLAPVLPNAPKYPKTPPLRTQVPIGGTLPGGEAAVLAVCIQYPDGATREQITILAGYKKSTRDAYIQRLAQRGYVTVSGPLIVPTEEGFAALPDVEPLPSGADLQNYWLSRLPEGEGKVLAATIEAYPKPASRDQISESTGYKKSTRDAYIQRLAARLLLKDAGTGRVLASHILF